VLSVGTLFANLLYYIGKWPLMADFVEFTSDKEEIKQGRRVGFDLARRPIHKKGAT
jgi:hypothetical protein